jgi:serine phosphatase RsbU (regulator of sigma subunit)
MLAHGEVLGTFVIDYSNLTTSHANQQDQVEVFDERLAILQGIANQTATAVENIRLLKAQKEEAYVSVALLQVAQAVVSSNDLDETLGSIVRITPILVGVKRSAIFLWEETRNAFRLAQSYGLPRGAGESFFTTQEFPLLAAVREWDTTLAYPLDSQFQEQETSSGVLLPPNSWMRLPAPDPQMVEQYLIESEYLLLAFPLSVKGEVLGVMLTEEPEPVGVTAPAAGGTVRRLREKRLEITTGISQQAALAIQSDRMQRQVVERERLQREMQLAREIQHAFLPHDLPELPNWEVSARWQTARQVGGDFYDVFWLPDGRLGLVIADVADKGMPAALFMTLSRTLVRATVQQEPSPAAVLERVNDVIVPDAPDGMFVTIFYGVLELESGKLTYANAGHNLPLIYHPQTGSIEPLERSGMALGVLEGNRLQELSTTLEIGDILTLYTDGVTEAFSPGGELFGTSGLQEAICASQADSAEEMLDAIDDALSDFTEDSFLTDDLTVLVVRRSFPPATPA